MPPRALNARKAHASFRWVVSHKSRHGRDDCVAGVVGLEVRRETGKEQVVQVHHDEGVAIHIGPEPCVGVRKDGDEASVGEGIGQPLSREISVPGADAVSRAEGNTFRTRHRKVRTARRGRRTWHVQKLLGREPGDPRSGQWRYAALARIGKARSRSR